MVSGDKGALCGVPGCIDFMEEYFLIPAQGDGIHLPRQRVSSPRQAYPRQPSHSGAQPD